MAVNTNVDEATQKNANEATTINKIYTVGYLFSIHKGNFAEW